MKKLITICITVGILFVLFLVTPATAITTYSLDDGTVDMLIGPSPVPGDTLWWANAFETQPGAEVITSVDVYFSSFSRLNPAGQPFKVFLYDDTDNDGNPGIGLQLLTSGDFMTGAFDTWSSYDIADTAVSGTFFVAAQLTQDSQQFPAAIDLTTSLGKSWLSINEGGSFSLAADYGYFGNWMLRANGTGVVIPAPGAILLGSIGVALVGWLRRRRTL